MGVMRSLLRQPAAEVEPWLARFDPKTNSDYMGYRTDLVALLIELQGKDPKAAAKEAAPAKQEDAKAWAGEPYLLDFCAASGRPLDVKGSRTTHCRGCSPLTATWSVRPSIRGSTRRGSLAPCSVRWPVS